MSKSSERISGSLSSSMAESCMSGRPVVEIRSVAAVLWLLPVLFVLLVAVLFSTADTHT